MKNQTLSANSPLNHWVQDHWERAPILEEYGLDFCCGGQQSLAEACRDKGLKVEPVVARLLAAGPAEAAPEEPDWTEAPVEELIDHIESKHHVYLKAALPQISEQIDKVLAAHGAHHPELQELAARYAELRADLEPHLMKEERILFPMMRQTLGGMTGDMGGCGGVRRPISVMRSEHEHAGDLLKQIREVTGNYQVPEDGCASYRSMMEALRRLEEDTHLHIYLENAVLFPRVMGEAVDLEF